MEVGSQQQTQDDDRRRSISGGRWLAPFVGALIGIRWYKRVARGAGRTAEAGPPLAKFATVGRLENREAPKSRPRPRDG